MQDGDPPRGEHDTPFAIPAPKARSKTQWPRTVRLFRVGFAALWAVVHVTFLLAERRHFGADFGFPVFRESTSIHVALYREVVGSDGQRLQVHVEDGVWTAKDKRGKLRRFAWTDRVRQRELALFDRSATPDLGVEEALARLQSALDDVAAHADDDTETRRLLLEVTVHQSGDEPRVVHLSSKPLATGS